MLNINFLLGLGDWGFGDWGLGIGDWGLGIGIKKLRLIFYSPSRAGGRGLSYLLTFVRRC